MRAKTIILCLFTVAMSFASSAQRIVVDTTSTNKYIIKKKVAADSSEQVASKEDLNFGDRALSIGKGILNRLKARLNLEEASESLKAKGEKFLGKREEEEDDSKSNEDEGN